MNSWKNTGKTGWWKTGSSVKEGCVKWRTKYITKIKYYFLIAKKTPFFYAVNFFVDSHIPESELQISNAGRRYDTMMPIEKIDLPVNKEIQ